MQFDKLYMCTLYFITQHGLEGKLYLSQAAIMIKMSLVY